MICDCQVVFLRRCCSANSLLLPKQHFKESNQHQEHLYLVPTVNAFISNFVYFCCFRSHGQREFLICCFL